MESRALDRATAFTDAAVAIALTLLVLPLVDVARTAGDTRVVDLLTAHGGDLLAFVISFFVVMVYWRAHRRLFEPVRDLDETLLTLNSVWLLGVVFLPVPTAVLTFDLDDQAGAAAFYLANLLLISLANVAMGLWVAKRPGLTRPEDAPLVRRLLRRGLVVLVTVTVAAILVVPLGAAALLLLAALPVVQQFNRPR